MAISELSRPEFHDPKVAREWLEAELWPNGPICPHCKCLNQATSLRGKAHREGLYQCNPCRKQFTVTVGTLYERSRIGLHKWLAATHLICASKKGVSSLQLHRLLGVTKKTAWFLGHRIRASLTEHAPALLGGEDKPVEADETYWGNKRGVPVKDGPHHKRAIFSVLERGASVRSFHVPEVTRDALLAITDANIDPASILNTDEALRYRKIGRTFKEHKVINHTRGEYAIGTTTTNSVEGFFSVFKRGMTGIYQHCSEAHLHRYLSEFDYRYNTREKLGVNDRQRMRKSLKGITGKRLTYRQTVAPKA